MQSFTLFGGAPRRHASVKVPWRACNKDCSFSQHCCCTLLSLHLTRVDLLKAGVLHGLDCKKYVLLSCDCERHTHSHVYLWLYVVQCFV